MLIVIQITLPCVIQLVQILKVYIGYIKKIKNTLIMRIRGSLIVSNRDYPHEVTKVKVKEDHWHFLFLIKMEKIKIKLIIILYPISK